MLLKFIHNPEDNLSLNKAVGILYPVVTQIQTTSPTITVSSVYISYQHPLISCQLSISQPGFKITLILPVL